MGSGDGLRGGGHCSEKGRRGQGDGLRGGVRASGGNSGDASNLEATFKNMTLFKNTHCPLTYVLSESCFISVTPDTGSDAARENQIQGKSRRNGGRKRSPHRDAPHPTPCHRDRPGWALQQERLADLQPGI